MIRFLVPLPPSSNALWRLRTGGKSLYNRPGKPARTGVTLSQVYMLYRDQVAAMVADQVATYQDMRPGNVTKTLPLYGALEVCALVFWPDDRTRDGTNLWKALLDALQAARVFQNDNQVKRAVQDEAPGVHRGNGCVWCCIRPLAVRPAGYPFEPPYCAPADEARAALLERFAGFKPTPL